jgi:hypothetical protein
MKKLVLAAFTALLANGGLTAASVYRIDFSGTITGGAALGYNPAVDDLSLTLIAYLTGVRVSGSLYFDLGLAPGPEVTIDGGGLVTTAIASSSLPVFMREDFVIEGFTVPAGFYPMPTVFDQPAVPEVPGSPVTVWSSSQSLSTQTRTISSAQSLQAGMSFHDEWHGSRFDGESLMSLEVLISSVQPFFNVPPIGSFPDAWGPAPVGGNGQFNFNVRSGDRTVLVNRGFAQYYQVTGNFEIDSASGGFLTPEPSTVVLGAAGLALLVAGRTAKRDRATS